MKSLDLIKKEIAELYKEHVFGSSMGRKFLCTAPGIIFQLIGEVETLKAALDDHDPFLG